MPKKTNIEENKEEMPLAAVEDTKAKKEPKAKKEKPVKEVKEKKPRKYSFIDAFSEWRKANDWSGLCPKKETKEYTEIRTLYDSKK